MLRNSMYPVIRRRQPAWRIKLNATVRDTSVLLGEFRWPLLSFLVIIAIGGWAYYELSALAGIPLDAPVEAAFLMLGMIFLQANAEFPHAWYLQIFFFLMPLLGLGVLSAGVADFGALLFNRSQRGEAWQVALANSYSGHIVVCGVGHLGLRIVRELHQLGYPVVCLERNPAAERLRQIQDWNVPIIVDDARNREALERTGLARAAAIIICTNDDLLNLQISMFAREIQPNIRVVMRLYDEDFACQVRKKFDVDAVLSTSAIAAPAFAGAATQTDIAHSFTLDREVLNASRLTVMPSAPLVGLTVSRLEDEWDLTVVRHRRGDRTLLHPPNDIIIQAGDELVVFASLSTLHKLAHQNR